MVRTPTEKSKRFYVTAGLLYPSTLGAAIAWLVPAVALAWKSPEHEPSWWSVAFGAWFVLYHSVWFVHLARIGERSTFKYTCWAFASDLVDVLALFVAFLALGFASAQYSQLHPEWVYAAALLVPASAVIDQKFHKTRSTWLMLLVPVILAGIGIALQRNLDAPIRGTDYVLLGILWLLLILYLVKPRIFSSQLGRRGRAS